MTDTNRIEILKNKILLCEGAARRALEIYGNETAHRIHVQAADAARDELAKIGQ